MPRWENTFSAPAEGDSISYSAVRSLRSALPKGPFLGNFRLAGNPPARPASAMIPIILSLVAALIARYPFAVVAAHFPLLFRSNPQPAVSQSVQVHT